MAKQMILAVAFDDESNNYLVDIPSGSSVNETAFAMSVVIRCLEHDHVIENPDIMLDAVKHYLNDPQYAPLEEDNESSD